MRKKKSKLDLSVKECMSKVHTVLQSEQTIEEGLAYLRKQGIKDTIVYFYVVDKENKLLGVVATRELLLSNPQTPVVKVMHRALVTVKENQSLEEALEIFDRHKLLALPVVDDDGKLKGIIDVAQYMEESYDLADARHRRDVFQMVGLTLEEKVSVLRGYKLRMPWLFCNMFSGIICAIISRINESVISQFLVLAMFIPLVLTLSESVSMQSMTQSMQILKKPKISLSYTFSRLFREGKTVTLLSITSGLVVGLISIFWGDGIVASLTIGIGIFVSVILAAGFGTLIPILLHTFSLDPKVASGPVVLMLADILTTLFYLTLASMLLL
jgi:magnesium transporter